MSITVVTSFVSAILACLAYPCQGQFTDSFDDSEFTSNPAWTGTDSKYLVDSGLLRLSAPAEAGSAYLSTPSESINDATWEFFIHMDFDPSSSNFARIYLTSDQADLTSPLNGYFILVGGTPDQVSLCLQLGTSVTKLIEGDSSIQARGDPGMVVARVKATRSLSGHWELFSDVDSTGTYQLEGTVENNAADASQYFGVYCAYTATRSDKFYFDEFQVSGDGFIDLMPPGLDSIAIVTPEKLRLRFSEAVSDSTATDPLHYSFSGDSAFVTSAVRLPDSIHVDLTLADSMANGAELRLIVSGVTDLAGNEIVNDPFEFLYFIPVPPVERVIVISEIMADPSPVITTLPDAEYIELLNASDQPYDLEGWTITDGVTVATFPSQIVRPGEFWIVTSGVSAALFPTSHVLGLPGFPALNNGGDELTLSSTDKVLIDRVRYTDAWYGDLSKQEGGWSLEIIDPHNRCIGEANWTASRSPAGGTPAAENSVNDTLVDLSGPELLSAFPASSTSIVLRFNERLATTIPPVAGFDFEPACTVTDVRFYDSLMQALVLTMDPISAGILYNITVHDVLDCAQNAIADTLNLCAFGLPETAEEGEVVINELLFNPLVGGEDFVELFNASNKFVNLRGWGIANLEDGLPDNLKVISKDDRLLFPGGYLLLARAPLTVRIQFPLTQLANAITLSSLPYLPDHSGSVCVIRGDSTVIDHFLYNESMHTASEVEGVSLERLDALGNTNDAANWKSATGPAATPGYANTKPIPPVPSLDSLAVLPPSRLRLRFSVILDPASAEDASRYSASGGLNQPLYASLETDSIHVNLTFAMDFINGVEYVLGISGVMSKAGVTIETTERTFMHLTPTAPAENDIIITEILADPAPAVALPDAEYVEIYNRSKAPFDLSGWTLSDETTIAVLPHQIILPGSYWVLTGSRSAALFSDIVSVLPVDGFPLLNNTGDRLTLGEPGGMVIDRVAYAAAWYGSDEKQDGGWSLELIDPQDVCRERENWTASEDAAGGTPGAPNSVRAHRPDITGPALLAALPVGGEAIALLFDEKLNTILPPAMSFTISPQTNVNDVSFADASLEKLLLSVDPLQPAVQYRLTAAAIRDCAGNPLREGYGTVSFALPEEAQAGDVAINEILFNPSPTGVDFVELVNISEKYINLNGWILTNTTDTALENPHRLFHDQDYLMAPYEILALTADRSVLTSEYLRAVEERIFEMLSLPSFPDDEGSVVVLSKRGELIDRFDYTSGMHSVFLKDPEGVSLERLDPSQPTQDPNNWRSSSSENGFATPGYVNSNSAAGIVSPSALDVQPEVFQPLRGMPGFTRISYNLDHGGYTANISINDNQGRSVKTIAHNVLLGTSGFFRWDGDTDGGRQARSGYYVIVFELFDSSGFRQTLVHRIVVVSGS